MAQLPKYKCHKTVMAAKILEVVHLENPDKSGKSAAASYGASLVFDMALGHKTVSAEFVVKHKPQAGGYYVEYEGGYQSFSPAQAFESGYHIVDLGSVGGPDAIESKIQAKGLVAPRITPTDIAANIASEHYFTGFQAACIGSAVYHQAEHDAEPLRLLTFCVLVLCNGFTVTGESACVSPENFDAQIGRDVARKNAIEKIWPLMGYALKEKLAAQ